MVIVEQPQNTPIRLRKVQKPRLPALTHYFNALSLTVIFLLSNSFPARADDDAAKQAKYIKQLEANVDLRRPSNNRTQSYYFLLDESGKELKKMPYDWVGQFAEGLANASIRQDKIFGYVDKEGNLVIRLQSDPISRFSEGLAVVYPEDGRNGFIDRTGKQVIGDKKFFCPKPFSESLAAVRVRTDAKQIDTGAISGDNLPGKWGYLDKAGNLVIAPQYDDADKFHQGLAAVKLGKQWFFINKQGITKSEKYSAIGSFAEGLAPVKGGTKWGYISLDGKLKIAAHFDEASPFSNGLAKVKVDGKFGFINSSGDYAIKPCFQSAGRFSEGYCAVQTNDNKWGYLNKIGQIILPALYDTADEFSCGRALIKLNDHFGFIDTHGTYVVEPKYDYAFAYVDGRAIATSKNWDHPIMKSALMGAHLASLNVHKDDASPTHVYIPENLVDALKELDALLPSQAKADMQLIEKNDMIYYHHGFGTWLRNNWGLWKGSRLFLYMKSLGFVHPDDMSGALLDAYWSKLHGQQEDIAKKAVQSKEYWDKLRPVAIESIAIPSNILQTKLTDSIGKTIDLNELVHSSEVTVLSLCDKTDSLSPKIIDVLDQQQALYAPRQVRCLAILPTMQVGGTIKTLADLRQVNFDLTGAEDKNRIKEKTGGCLRAEGSDKLFQELAGLFKLAPLVIPQTFIIDKQGVVVKRLSNFDKNTSTNLRDAIQECLAGEKK